MYKKGFIAVPVILVMFAVGFFLTEEDSIDSKNTVKPIKVASIKTTTPELKAKEIKSPSKSQKKHTQNVNVSEDLGQIAEAKFEIIESLKYHPFLGEVFSDLQRRANEGDAEAAHQLGQGLQNCAYQPRSQSDYDQLIANDLSLPIAAADAAFARCKGITDEQLTYSTKYLEQAAKAGILEAQLDLFSAAPLEIESFNDNNEPQDVSEIKYLKELNKRKFEYANTALEEGNFNAALKLALSYTNKQASESISPTGYDPNKGVEVLQTAILMNGGDDEKQGLGLYLEILRLEMPVYEYEAAIREGNNFYQNSLADKKITYIESNYKGYKE